VDSTTQEPPEILTTAAVMYTGYWLATCHGARDYDKDNKVINRYTADFQSAKEIMAMIQSGEHFLLNVQA
jgi:hypothetical protein